MEERYNLAIDRMKAIIEEKTVAEPYREYFQHVARFILKLDELKQNVESGKQKEMSEEELQEEMKDLYADELEANYEKSYANPAYAVLVLGGELGSFLSAVYTEIRGSISYVQEQRMEYVVIGAELLIEIYNKFEEEKQPQPESLKEIFYWYASDYCDVFAADRIKDQIDPERGCFIVNMIMNEDLSDLRYLYRMGEYVGVNERETAAYLNSLSQEKIDKMADTFSEGYRIGFVNTGKDLSKKSVVNIYYAMGFERIVKKAIENFAKMGLKPSIFRTSHSVITRGRNSQIGFFNISGNKQYVYDHRDDIGLVMDKQYVERKLEVMRTTYEQNKEIAAGYAGPAVIDIFGEKTFVPQAKPEAVKLSEKQEELLVAMNGRAGRLTNEYLPGDERSFTIISWPVPEIGEQYHEIFDETIKINTLDYKLYQKVQQTMIDALDKGEYVKVTGSGENQTDLKVMLHPLADPAKETIFENCVADVNIPVGEVFTSPVLEGTEGTLFVSKVFLHGLPYYNLKISFKEGKITREELTKVEDKEIAALVEKEVAHKLPYVTDGEFRRRWWHLDWLKEFDGFETKHLTKEINGTINEIELGVVTGKVFYDKNKKHPEVEAWDYLHSLAQKYEGVTAKKCISGPNMIFIDHFLQLGNKETPYYGTNVEALIDDVAKAYQDAIADFYDHGCRYIQIDDTSWTYLIDETFLKKVDALGYKKEEILDWFKRVSTKALDNKPEDMFIATHFCKGNFKGNPLFHGFRSTSDR